MKKHILVISQYFHPEQFRINDICLEWLKRGYQVTVITGIPNYPTGKYYKGYGLFDKRRESFNGVDIIRIPLIPRGHNSIMLALNYLSFVWSDFFWKVFTKIKADFVFIFEVSPMTQALPGVWYAKKRKIPCYIYVQDLWPENVEIITGITNKKVINSIGKMVDYIYKNCTRIFTSSSSFVESINQRGIPLDKIEFWPQYAEAFYKPLPKTKVSEIPDDGSFDIIFAGNIGFAQGLEILPEVAKVLEAKSDKKIRFHIVGEGRFLSELLKIVQNTGVNKYFNFIPKQPASRIPEFLASCDAAFLCLTDNPVFEKTIPAKLQTYMTCGSPIIASASGETKEIIFRSNCGICSKPGDINELAENIIEFAQLRELELKRYGQNAVRYAEDHFNKEKLLDRMDFYFK